MLLWQYNNTEVFIHNSAKVCKLSLKLFRYATQNNLLVCLCYEMVCANDISEGCGEAAAVYVFAKYYIKMDKKAGSELWNSFPSVTS